MSLDFNSPSCCVMSSHIFAMFDLPFQWWSVSIDTGHVKKKKKLGPPGDAIAKSWLHASTTETFEKNPQICRLPISKHVDHKTQSTISWILRIPLHEIPLYIVKPHCKKSWKLLILAGACGIIVARKLTLRLFESRNLFIVSRRPTKKISEILDNFFKKLSSKFILVLLKFTTCWLRGWSESSSVFLLRRKTFLHEWIAIHENWLNGCYGGVLSIT